MSSRGIRVIPDELRTLAFGAIGAGYTAIGAVFDNPIRIISLKNLTDHTLVFSYDGVTDHEILPSESGLVLDFTANSANASFPFIAAGTTIYVKDNGVGPTTGLAAVSAYYCKGD
jgi:hypothetical protein